MSFSMLTLCASALRLTLSVRNMLAITAMLCSRGSVRLLTPAGVRQSTALNQQETILHGCCVTTVNCGITSSAKILTANQMTDFMSVYCVRHTLPNYRSKPMGTDMASHISQCHGGGFWHLFTFWARWRQEGLPAVKKTAPYSSTETV